MAAKSPSHWPITLTNGAAALLSIFLPLALVRILSPDQVGRYNIFFLYVMLFPGLFLTGGLTNGLYLWAGRFPEAISEVRQSWTLLLGITLTVCAMGLIGVPWAAPWIKMPPRDLQLILLSIPFSITSSFFEDLLIARGKIWTGAQYGSISNVLRTFSLLAAAWWTRRVEAVFWVFLAAVVIRSAVGWLLVRKEGEIEWMFSWDKTKSVLRYAIPVSLAAMAVMALSHVDQLVLSFRLSPAAFAFYAMGCLSIPPLEIFETSVNRVLIPRLSEAFGSHELSQAAELFAEAVSELFRFLLPATLGLMIYAGPIVRILLTERYMPAAAILRVFALSYLFLSIPSSTVARARGDGTWIMRTTILFAALCTAATWFAARQWNAMGALSAVLASQLSLRVYSLFYDRKNFSVPFSKFLPLKDLGIQIGIAMTAAAVSVLTRPLFNDSRIWFLVTGSLFTVIYLGGTYAVGLRQHVTASGPIHVLELAQTLCLGGLERTVYSLAQTLNQHKRFKVLVATYDHFDGQPSLAPQFKEAGIPLTQWEKGKGFSLGSVVRLVHLIYSENTRILHVHDLGPLVYGSLAKLFSLGRVRLILTQHNRLLDIQRTPRYRFYYKFFLRFPDRIIAVSEGVRSALTELGVSPERIEVIPNGASFSYFGERPGESVDKPALRKRIVPSLSPDLYGASWLICLARLNPGKGQDVVLDVWSSLPKEVRAKLALFFVGQETDARYGRALREKIQALPDANRIIFTGPSEHPREWIQCADLFISGSLNEGMPLAPLEAAGSGLPIVLSDIEGHRFLKPWAYTFDPAKPDEGAQKIRDVLETLSSDGGTRSLENRWKAAASLRERWGTPTMTNSYAELFSCV